MRAKKKLISWLRSAIGWFAFVLIILLSIEGASQLAYHTLAGKWYRGVRKASALRLIRPHPYFGCCYLPNRSETRNGIRVTNNSYGTRGAEFKLAKTPGRTRIVAVGGSTTYCAGVSDQFTWPQLLQDQLGKGYEVINLGVQGYSSLEHLAQTALLFSDLQPDIAIYYCGWNDAQSQHIRNLKADYSDFHGRVVMAEALGGSLPEEPLASLYILKRLLFTWFFSEMDDPLALPRRYVSPSEDAFTDRSDARALGLWERNLRLTAELCRKQGVRPIYVPQILNWNILVSDRPYGWIPFVRDRDLKTIMDSYHKSMARVASEEHVSYVREMLDEPFSEKDFSDNGHFVPEGNRRFARVLAQYIQQEGNQLSQRPEMESFARH